MGSTNGKNTNQIDSKENLLADLGFSKEMKTLANSIPTGKFEKIQDELGNGKLDADKIAFLESLNAEKKGIKDFVDGLFQGLDANALLELKNDKSTNQQINQIKKLISIYNLKDGYGRDYITLLQKTKDQDLGNAEVRLKQLLTLNIQDKFVFDIGRKLFAADISDKEITILGNNLSKDQKHLLELYANIKIQSSTGSDIYSDYDHSFLSKIKDLIGKNDSNVIKIGNTLRALKYDYMASKTHKETNKLAGLEDMDGLSEKGYKVTKENIRKIENKEITEKKIEGKYLLPGNVVEPKDIDSIPKFREISEILNNPNVNIKSIDIVGMASNIPCSLDTTIMGIRIQKDNPSLAQARAAVLEAWIKGKLAASGKTNVIITKSSKVNGPDWDPNADLDIYKEFQKSAINMDYEEIKTTTTIEKKYDAALDDNLDQFKFENIVLVRPKLDKKGFAIKQDSRGNIMTRDSKGRYLNAESKDPIGFMTDLYEKVQLNISGGAIHGVVGLNRLPVGAKDPSLEYAQQKYIERNKKPYMLVTEKEFYDEKDPSKIEIDTDSFMAGNLNKVPSMRFAQNVEKNGKIDPQKAYDIMKQQFIQQHNELVASRKTNKTK